MVKQNYLLFFGLIIALIIVVLSFLSKSEPIVFNPQMIFAFFIFSEILVVWFLRKRYSLNEKHYVFLILETILVFFWMIINSPDIDISYTPILLISLVVFSIWTHKSRQKNNRLRGKISS